MLSSKCSTATATASTANQAQTATATAETVIRLKQQQQRENCQSGTRSLEKLSFRNKEREGFPQINN